MQIFLASLSLFFLPFIIFPFGPSPFETPKILVFEFLTFTLLLYSLFRIKFKIEHFKSLPFILITGIVFLSLFHLFFFNTKTTFLGNPFRLQGIFLLWILLIFSFLSSFINIKKLNSNFYFASFAALFTTTILFGTNEAGRSIGPLGEPNSLAATALFLFPFIYFGSNLRASSNFILKILGVLGILFIVFLSGSRSGLIGFFIQLLFVSLVWINRRTTQNSTLNYAEKKNLLIEPVLAAFFLILLSLTLPFIEGGGIYENRADIWKTSFVAGLNSPIVGNGFGNMESILNQTAVKTSSNVQYEYVDSSHNILLDFWVQGGILGTFLLTSLITVSLKNLIKRQKIMEITSLLGVFISMLFNPMSIVILVYFWFLIGQGIRINTENGCQ